MNNTVLKTSKEYDQALQRLEEIFNATPGSPDGDELELLSLLIEKYEADHFPIDLPDPIEAIKFRMEQLGYNNADLARVLGFRSRVSEAAARNARSGTGFVRVSRTGAIRESGRTSSLSIGLLHRCTLRTVPAPS